MQTRFSTHFSPRRFKVQVWGWQSRGPLSRRMVVASGPRRTPGQEQRFTLRFQIQLQWPHDLTWRYDASMGQCSFSNLCHPAVHEQLDAVDITAVVRCQEKYGFGHFFNRTGSSLIGAEITLPYAQQVLKNF